MQFTNPLPSDFKSQFMRDFPYDPTGSSGDMSFVQDADIQNAINQSAIEINPALYPGQAPYTMGFLNLAAHHLVLNLRASGQGIAGQWPWMVTSKGVGGVSQGITVPEWIQRNAMLMYYSSTRYGMSYIEFLLPQLVAVCATAVAQTNP